MKLHRAWSPTTSDGTILEVTPYDAGWHWSGVSIVALSPGKPRVIATDQVELFVLPLSGGLRVEVTNTEGAELGSWDVEGRESVFTRVTDFVYVGRDSVATLTAPDGAEVALPSARCDRHRPPAYGAAEDVPVEVRGAGNATRQVTNFGVPGVWDHAEKLIACELITPPGNWSSYPPHKHDASEPCPVVNEEIYYYRIAGPDQVTPSRTGVGYHRTYTGPEHAAAGLESLDELFEVRDNDIVLVPYGYHGPSIAAPGYPMYYLNVMAGPGENRALAFCDDTSHGWVRDTWAETETDARCPVTSAAGRHDDVTPTSRERHS